MTIAAAAVVREVVALEVAEGQTLAEAVALAAAVVLEAADREAGQVAALAVAIRMLAKVAAVLQAVQSPSPRQRLRHRTIPTTDLHRRVVKS